MSVDAAIQAALYGHLKRITLPTALPIAPEGKSYNARGKSYLRPTYLPAEATAAQLSDKGDAEHVGFYQIDVFWKAGEGIAEPLAVADAIRAHFARGLRVFLDNVDLRVTRQPFTLPALQDEAWLQIPVRVPWWACVTADA